MAKYHYVSKFYYKNFVDSAEEPFVYKMNKEGVISNRRRSARQIGYDLDYNTHDQEIEQGRLETKYSEVLRAFIKNPDPGCSVLSRDLMDFISFLLGNNIDTRKKLDEGFSKMELKIRGAPDDHNISTHRGHKGRYDWSIAFADAAFEEFGSWDFFPCEVNCKTTDDKFLITSDNPVSIFDPKNIKTPIPINTKWRDPRIADVGDESIRDSDGRLSRDLQLRMTLESVSFGKDVVMVFPVTPSLCIVGFSDRVRSKKFRANPKKGLAALSFFNCVTFCQCNKEVYSHNDGFLRKTKIDMDKFLEFCKRKGSTPSYDKAFGK